MLVSEAMPPWYADPTGPAVRHPRALTSRELDIIVTWASGGAPQGDPREQPRSTTRAAQWLMGKPDLVLQMPSAHEVPARVPQETVDLQVPTNLPSPQWVRAADVLPGSPSMVRRAEISVLDGPVLRVWEPGGDELAGSPDGTAFELRAGAILRVRLFYKKPWQEEQEARTDRSAIGLYFTRPPTDGKGIAAVRIVGPSESHDAAISFGGTMPVRGRIVAIRPSLDRPYAAFQVAAVDATQKRLELLKLHAARPEWPRRYWLVTPVEIPPGARIEVTGTAADSDATADATAAPLEVGLDFVPE
jgi:hypothetical protein